MYNKNLVWFNKEGDNLNFKYNDNTNIYEGNILFHENSSDTFKTYGLYMMEKVPSFEFESIELETKKFQLFNEKGIHFYGSKYFEQDIINIEAVNNDPSFKSKWIYGEDFENKFKIGTLIQFTEDFFEFTTNRTYNVVGSKKGAIMIISNMDNSTFDSSYTHNTNSKISGVNAIGVYDYININYSSPLSIWNERDFFDKYFIGKKLNIVNSKFNDGVVTIKEHLLLDQTHFEYSMGYNELGNNDLVIEVITKTDVPKIYDGSINILNNRLYITGLYPQILKPGMEFKIIGSTNNTNFLSVGDIPQWEGINTLTNFSIDDQVIFENKVYQCLIPYTQDFSDTNTSNINPFNSSNWGEPTYINSSAVNDTLFGQLYLTSDRYYFEYLFNGDVESTVASAAVKFREDLKIFNIDLFYESGSIKADLIYPSEYAIVNFQQNGVNKGTITKKVERLVSLKENIENELNYDYSNNYRKNIIFTDIDNYGVKITINGQLYEIEASIINSGNAIDMERTIDRTLRNWLSKNFIPLYKLGIETELGYGNYGNIFANSIIIKSHYPNVPYDIEKILVGSTAEFYIEHSNVTFINIGNRLNIKINNNDYSVDFNTDITTTLSDWVSNFKDVLNTYGILVSNTNSSIIFNYNRINMPFEYTIDIGEISIPGIEDYIIQKRTSGNEGLLIASNELVLDTELFEGFSTGMLLSLNNTTWTYMNREFNIQYLYDSIIGLSYEGPFWGTTDTLCNISPFVTIAFDDGFKQEDCEESGELGGHFDEKQFNLDFFINNTNSNIYSNHIMNLGIDNLIDIKYIGISNTIFVLGDKLAILDASGSNLLNTIDIGSDVIKMEFNNIDNLVYILSKDDLYIVDPNNRTLINTLSIGITANDLCINKENGDVYITGTGSNFFVYSNGVVNVVNPTDTASAVVSINESFKMVYNDFDKNIYMTTVDGKLLRINKNRIVAGVYAIDDLKEEIYYEPINETIFVYGVLNNDGFVDLLRIDGINIAKVEDINNNKIAYTANDIIYNNISGEMNISDVSYIRYMNLDISTPSDIKSYPLSDQGYLAINQFDTDLYLSSQTNNKIMVIRDGQTLDVMSTTLPGQTTKIIYNPERKTMLALIPSDNSIIEIGVTIGELNIDDEINADVITDNMYGTLDPNYVRKSRLWLKTRDYIRKPRKNFKNEDRVKYYWRWLIDDRPEFFLYDFSGDQLLTNDAYEYKGLKPLENIVLNKKPNRDLSKLESPEYQQTIFDRIEYPLPYFDDVDEFTSEVEPLQLFIGFRSDDEGAFESTLQLYEKEDIKFTINSDEDSYITMDTIERDGDRYGEIKLNSVSENFTNRGLKSGQRIVIYLKDNSKNNQFVSFNTASIFIIRDVYTKALTLDFVKSTDTLYEESTKFDNTLLDFTLKVMDKELARLSVYGQTEEEDERFRIELGNQGKLINPDEVFIFKEYDILEGGIDWKILNKKRKEMLMSKNLIYPYIGSYKSIINAINYFGYNDLQLNEYYRNVDSSSENFSKLFKVEIPDIFDNSVEGWEESDFIKNTYPNDNFQETNLFNLTYNITDKEGNNILDYTLDEVIIKLQGLKYWLKKNIIPLTHKIMDITGKSYFKHTNSILHRVHDVKIYNMRQEMCPVSVLLNEAYLMPVNSGSTVYNCVLDFYSIIPGMGTERQYLLEDIKPYNGSNLTPPDYFNVKIRTYKTYKEWAPFVVYKKGSKVVYYDKLYISNIDNNKTKNPRKYKGASQWTANINYSVASIVEYEGDYYVCRNITNDSPINNPNWFNITEWREISYEPVQTIDEFRSGDNLLPFNFTLDSNLDPFITIDVTSDNGYGQIYTDRKNYEIRGMKDLIDDSGDFDRIGEFEPIINNFCPTTTVINLELMYIGDDIELSLVSGSFFVKNNSAQTIDIYTSIDMREIPTGGEENYGNGEFLISISKYCEYYFEVIEDGITEKSVSGLDTCSLNFLINTAGVDTIIVFNKIGTDIDEMVIYTSIDDIVYTQNSIINRSDLIEIGDILTHTIQGVHTLVRIRTTGVCKVNVDGTN